MKHFKEKEFECSCCGENKTSKVLMEKLDEARDIAHIPFIINSGYRCPEHNEAVGGSETSSHLKGLAVDIAAANSHARYRIVEALIMAGFNRIGIANSFVHADIDSGKSEEVIWLYQ